MSITCSGKLTGDFVTRYLVLLDLSKTRTVIYSAMRRTGSADQESILTICCTDHPHSRKTGGAYLENIVEISFLSETLSDIEG